MQKSAVAAQSTLRKHRQPLARAHMEKGQKFEPFNALDGERRSAAWLQKVDRKR